MDKFIQDLRTMSIRDLEFKIGNLQEEYLRLRCENKIGQLTNKMALRKVRREIAKAKTILVERQIVKLAEAKN